MFYERQTKPELLPTIAETAAYENGLNLQRVLSTTLKDGCQTAA